MFHDSLRAVSLGWLVAERYGHKVQSSGSMVTAALKLAAHKRHAQQDADFETQSNFSTESITRYLPKSVLQNLEKKPGGVFPNLHKALVELTKFTNPSVVEEMEVAIEPPEDEGGAGEGGDGTGEPEKEEGREVREDRRKANK